MSNDNLFDSKRELSGRDFNTLRNDLLKNIKSCCIVMFYAPWCPHCHNMIPVIKELTKDIELYTYNIEKNKAHFGKLKRDNPNLVMGFPTLIFYKDGKPIGKYDGDRTKIKIEQAKRAACSKH